VEEDELLGYAAGTPANAAAANGGRLLCEGCARRCSWTVAGSEHSFFFLKLWVALRAANTFTVSGGPACRDDLKRLTEMLGS
jgi:hypothetical protein